MEFKRPPVPIPTAARMPVMMITNKAPFDSCGLEV